MKTTDLFRNFKQLTPEEEKHYARTDRNVLVERNLPFVWSVLNGCFPQVRNPDAKDDAFQEGVFGLIRASKKFDPDRGFRFSTYAFKWIYQFVSRHLVDNREIRIPIHAMKIVNATRKLENEGMTRSEAMAELRAQGYRQNTKGKSRLLQMDLREIQRLTAAVSATLFDGEESSDSVTSLFDYVVDPDENPEEQAADLEMAERLETELSFLTEREGAVIRKRLEGITLDEIGKQFGISRERVRQIESKQKTNLSSVLVEEV